MKNIFATTPLRFLLNLIIIYIAYGICRVAFVMENWGLFASDFQWSSVPEMLHGAWMFDTSAILYTNVLYALLMLIPLHYKEMRGWQMTAKWIFIIVNGVCIAANLADCVYFKYTMRRTTNTVFSEFSNEGNIGSIIGVEFLRHWYLVLLFVVMILAMWKCYFWGGSKKTLRKTSMPQGKGLLRYYVIQTLCFAIFIPLSICGMRGGATTAVRPITISNANQYVAHPQEAGIVLNTPFSLIRTIGKKVFVIPEYMSEQEMNALYSPLKNNQSSIISNQSSKKNVVILIVESFGREYIGGYNKWLDGGKYKGYTPFVDSLMQHSQTFLYSYCNGRKSIDGMPSILSSIPMFVEPFFLTPASMNDVSGIAGELKNKGYYSAFFHGAENGSMGFEAFARKTGFADYFGRTEYNADKRFNGDKDFDGMWAIWDEPFLQFFATKMSEFKQPFVSAVFTASSHHPYKVPEEYKDIYKEEGIVIHKCIRYTDNAIRRFFDKAKTQPWYKNTLFVITSDHTNLSDHAYYQTDLGGFCSPIIFFDPSGDLKPGMRNAIAQQIDIMPTVLSYLGYDRKYVAFGCDLLTTKDEDTWAVNYINGIYQYVKGDWLLQFDGHKAKALYRFRTDLLLKENLLSKEPKIAADMERQVKAIIQSYMTRMVNNQLVVQ
ncbi:MAG: sulfatase-like hydrolase/transferase [Prevotella sp.]|nr:sulfatase-like hydrolase/transferase [Prevotella sp.]